MAEKVIGLSVIADEEIYLKQDLAIKGDKGDIYVPFIDRDTTSEKFGFLTWELMDNPLEEDIQPVNIIGPEGKVFKPSIDDEGNISWELIRDPEVPDIKNIRGPVGPHYTPHVSDDGLITWQNNGNLENPEAINITGPRGYHFYPSIDEDGNITWTNDGNLNNPAPINIRGPQGYTFIPSLSVDGTLIWTNDGELENPNPVNIRGPQGIAGTLQIGEVNTGDAGTEVSIVNVGTTENAILNITIPKGDQGIKGDKGDGVKILGAYNSVDELKAAQPSGVPGDSYMINGEMYTWDDSTLTWIPAGKIQGPAGYVFTPNITEGILSWTNNGELENPPSVDITGPKGDKGDPGEKGESLTYSDMTEEEKSALNESIISDLNISFDGYATIEYVNELMMVDENTEI